MNSGGYLPSRESTAFTDTEVNNCFSIYHTSWITSGLKSNFICEIIATKAILFFFGCSEVISTWLITSDLANQRARKVLFTCVVYTKYYPIFKTTCVGKKIWRIIKTIVVIWGENMLGYFSEQIMSADKYPCIFSRHMATNVYLYHDLQKFLK